MVCYNLGYWIPEEILSRIHAAAAAQLHQAFGALPILPPQPEPLLTMGPMDPMVQNLEGQMAYYQAPAAAYHHQPAAAEPQQHYPVDPALLQHDYTQAFDMSAPLPSPPLFGGFDLQQPQPQPQPQLMSGFELDSQFPVLPNTPPEPDYSAIWKGAQEAAEEAHARLADLRAAQNVVGDGAVAASASASVENWLGNFPGASAPQSAAQGSAVQESSVHESYADYFDNGDGMEVSGLFGEHEIAPLGNQLEFSPEDPLFAAVTGMNL